jgi:sugar-specific transcriptional regulator TrmB
MSQEQVLKTLENLGFDQVDAQIYVYLAKKGLQKASDVCKALKLTKQQLYPSIKQLQSKGIVSSTMQHPARFSVMPFEKVLDLFIKAKIEDTQRLKQSKAEILSNWQNLKLEDDTLAKFMVIEGRSFIYSKIQNMIQETKRQVLVITTAPALAQADQRGIFSAIYDHHMKSKIKFRFLAELSGQNILIMKTLLKETANTKLNIEGRSPDLGLALYPQMLVRDEDEALFFVKPRKETSTIEQDDACLWTDCKTLVKAFTAIFEELWRNSTDVSEKIREIETGKPTPKTIIITDAEIAKKKYIHIMKMAKEEIYAITSSEGLTELSKDLLQVNDWTEKGVTIKIMAPITNENQEVATNLSNFCIVKHVPPNYNQTIIVDGKHLFQSNTSNTKNSMTDSPLKFENTFYTTNLEYVQKTKTMLQEIWKNSSPPSPKNLKSIFGRVRSQSAYFPGAIQSLGPDGTMYPLSPDDSTKKGDQVVIQIVDDDPLGKMTEQDVLNEIINDQKASPRNQPDTTKVYSSQAIAIIHPPDFFKLPPMLIRFHHNEKHSMWGEEDAIIINLWLETPSGHAYVPVAVFSDNPKNQVFWRRNYSATPASRNVQLANKNELKISLHGNTMFAGWTVPIHLFPEHNILPPACMLIEGYGNVKTEAYTIVQPSGGKFKAKQNGFNAFVTFMHPSSKYSGPGTDGFLVRDFIGEITPQFIKGFRSALETKLIENCDKTVT